MDPLSFTASLVAVTTLSVQLTKCFSKLRDVCRTLPGRLHALNNEIADLTAVLHDVGVLFADAEKLEGAAYQEQAALLHTFDQLQVKLAELKVIVEALTVACSKSSIPLLRARAWSRVQGRLQSLQEELKTYKSHLNIALGVSASYARTIP